MSSRVLKKLHGDNELDIRDEDASDLDNDNSFVASSGARKKQYDGNRYDLFQQSMSESEVKEDDNETEHNSTAAPNRPETKKKRRKRKKRSGKQSGCHKSSEDNADIEEIARSFKDMHRTASDGSASLHQPIASGSNVAATKALFAIQKKNLNPSFEMKRMFGSKVVQTKHPNDRRNGRGGGRALRTWLVTPKDDWPPATKTDLSMSIDTSRSAEIGPSQSENDSKYRSSSSARDKVQWFILEHNENYRHVQRKFLTAVESMDSDNIIKIVNQQPYHVDSLIQISELCKQFGEAMASDFIEHAILALESAFHPSFCSLTGNSRVDYRRQENRSLYIALFKHAQYLEGRACSRTALEIAKLILTFDPVNDPLAMILIVDYYALRAKQYEWLVKLYDEWDPTNNLSQLPNMAYSYALALFYLHKGQSQSELADKALQYAVLMFPGLVRPLLDALSVQIDSRASSHNYISSAAFEKQPASLQQLTSLYVVRATTVWKDNEILPWLERNVNVVLDRVDAKDPIVAEYSAKRSQRYKTPPRPILRHIILSDFKEKVPLAPFINKETDAIFLFDPLPPLDSIDIYERPKVGPTSRPLPDASPFSMFFQSLLPNFNVQGVRAADADAGALVGAAMAGRPENEVNWNEMQNQIDEELRLMQHRAEDGTDLNQPFDELRNSLVSVVDAMHNFLTNIRLPDRNDGDVDENETSDDEPNDYLT